MKDKVGTKEAVTVRKIVSGRCARCNGRLIVRENGVACESCGGAHQYVNRKWVYSGGSR
jgi:exosome complex RNA-binding protein Csl4